MFDPINDSVNWCPPDREQYCPVCQAYHHPAKPCPELVELLQIHSS